MKKYFIVTVTVLSMLLCTVTGFAENIDIMADKDLSQIQVGGSYDGFLKNEYVMLQILYPGKELGAVAGSGQSDVFKQITQTELDENGSFVFEPVIMDKSGEYTVIVTREKDGSKNISKVFIPTSDSVSTFLGKVNSADGMVNAINDDIKSPSVGLNSKFFAPLSSSAQARVISALEENKPFELLKDFEGDFIRESIMEYLVEKKTGSILGDALGFKGEFANYDYTKQLKKIMDYDTLAEKSVGKKLAQMTDTQFSKAGGYMSDIAFKDEKSYRDAVNVGIIKTFVAECKGWDGITAVIKDFGDVLTSAAASQYKTKACRELNLEIAEGNYKTVEELCEIITSYSAGGSSSNGGSGGNGGSSGGGFGSSFGGGTTLPSIAVGTEPSEQEGGVFTDLGGSEWAREAIYALYNRGVVSGKDANIFAPSDKILREEFAKLIVSAAGIEESEPVINFGDVRESDWYYTYVNRGFANGLIFGMSDSEFGSGRNITRQDMMVLLYRLAEKCGVQFSENSAAAEGFDDFAEASEYAVEAINGLCEKGIISGGGDNMLHLNDSLTRAEAAQAIYNLMLKAGRI